MQSKPLFLVVLIICCLQSSVFYSQQSSEAIALSKIYKDPSQKIENRLEALYSLAWDVYLESNPDSSLYYADLLLELATEVSNIQYQANALLTKGEALEIKGFFKQSVNFKTKSLKLFESINDQQGAGAALANIGTIYYHIEEYDNALRYFNRGLEYDKMFKDSIGMTHTIINIGAVEKQLKQYDKALNTYRKSLSLISDLNLPDQELKSHVLNNIGSLYISKNQLDSAQHYLWLVLDLQNEFESSTILVNTLNNLGKVHYLLGDNKNALKYSLESMRLARENKSLVEEKSAAYNLYEVYKIKGDATNALSMLELYYAKRDQIMSDENSKELSRLEMAYEYEKKVAEDSLRMEKEKEINASELKTAEQQRIFMASGIVMLLIFAGFVTNRYRITSNQKKIIQHQKSIVEKEKETSEFRRILVEEKNKEILDSIRYAKRLQEAILPTQKTIDSLIPDSFIFYQPKDIVAGDFYWIEKYKNSIYIASADCTGHGVPGAMVSVVCANSLNKSLIEEGIKDTGKILDRTRELVIEQFSKSEDEVKDGMDISLVRITFDRNTNYEVQFSGANNSLIFFQHNELFELKGDKQHIGLGESATPFTSQTITLQKSDSLYLFTDGYVDQFGGEDNKKYKISRLKEFLNSIQDYPMKKQGELLSSNFHQWKGDTEQLDDVCGIGVRV